MTAFPLVEIERIDGAAFALIRLVLNAPVDGESECLGRHCSIKLAAATTIEIAPRTLSI